MAFKAPLFADPADLTESDKLASYILGAAGEVATVTDIGAGVFALDVNVVAAVPFNVDLDHTTDSVTIGDGTDLLAINADGSINATVSATDLDIRNLVFATDKVDVSGSTVTVTATDLDIRNLDFATDKVDVSGSIVFSKQTASSFLAQAVTVGTTAVAVPAAALTNRIKIQVYNNGNKSIYVGGASVTTVTGFRLAPGVAEDFLLEAGAVLYAISTDAGQNVRIAEFAKA